MSGWTPTSTSEVGADWVLRIQACAPLGTTACSCSAPTWWAPQTPREAQKPHLSTACFPIPRTGENCYFYIKANPDLGWRRAVDLRGSGGWALPQLPEGFRGAGVAEGAPCVACVLWTIPAQGRPTSCRFCSTVGRPLVWTVPAGAERARMLQSLFFLSPSTGTELGRRCAVPKALPWGSPGQLCL